MRQPGACSVDSVPSSDALPWERDEFLELAERSAGIGVWDVELATGMVRARPQFFALMGLEATSEPVPIERIRAVRHPEDRSRVVDGFRQILSTGEDYYESEYRIVRPDGELRWILGRGRVVRDKSGVPLRYSGVDIDITDRKATEAALAESEGRYRALVDNANDIVATLDLDFRFTSVNPAVERVLGYSPEEIIGAPLSRFVPASQLAMHEAMLNRKLEGEAASQYEMELVGQGGRRFILEVNSTLILDGADQPVTIHAIARDITERKDAEARQALLVRELQHRAKNILAVMQSIISSTLRTSLDLKGAHEAIVGRLHALARAQEFIAWGRTGGAPIRDIIKSELEPFAARVLIEGPAVIAGGTFAQMFAIVIHELATNATKHGSLSVPSGRVYIRWSTNEDTFEFSWTERGGPPARPPAAVGFGSELINAALVAKPRIAFTHKGLEYAVNLPLSDVLGSVPATLTSEA